VFTPYYVRNCTFLACGSVFGGDRGAAGEATELGSACRTRFRGGSSGRRSRRRCDWEPPLDVLCRAGARLLSGCASANYIENILDLIHLVCIVA
jgi:hypothetical protein